MSEKGFLQDVRHNLWEILPGWGRRSGLRQLNSGEISHKVGRADCGNDFLDTLKALARRGKEILVIDSDESNYGLHRQLGMKLPRDFTDYYENGQHDEDNGSENMIIRGDNLEALKALLPRYEGQEI